MPGDITHGDLWLGNVLFTDNTLTGIIDWEWAQTDGLRLVDVLHLLFMSHSVFRNVGIGHCLRQFWADAIEDQALTDRLRELCVRFGLDMDDLKFAALLLWFDYLRQRAIRGRMPSLSWTEDMIPRTAPVIRNWLTGHRRGTIETTA
jgi:aminoglycoside phosphotransferase (APT) family kinase protein